MQAALNNIRFLFSGLHDARWVALLKKAPATSGEDLYSHLLYA
jgi:hypothetical protein